MYDAPFAGTKGFEDKFDSNFAKARGAPEGGRL